jgi:hypothetical protein
VTPDRLASSNATVLEDFDPADQPIEVLDDKTMW